VTPGRTEVIAVRGMHCGGCERSVSHAVKAVRGVASARADFVAEEVEVTYDPAETSLEAILSAVRDSGFTPA
jgi:copper chaperone CopZ